jgi:hypothetical protein
MGVGGTSGSGGVVWQPNAATSSSAGMMKRFM